MRRILFCTFMLLASATLAEAGDSDTQTAFEAASVRRATSVTAGPSGCMGGPVSGSADPTLLTCAGTPIKVLVLLAYNVQFYQIQGSELISSEMYDISARIPPGATRDQMRIMLRGLLEERFHLALHHESRQFPIYHLEVGKTELRMKRADDSKRAATVDQITGALGNIAGLPVVNDTGLPGKYEFSFKWKPENSAFARPPWKASSVRPRDERMDRRPKRARPNGYFAMRQG